MRKAYGLLGILILVVLVGAYVAARKAEAPTHTDTPPVTERLSSTNTTTRTMTLSLTSPAFENNASIPPQYTCDGANTSPELDIAGVPEGTVSLVLLMDDPDIPKEVKESRNIEKFDHWSLFNIDPSVTKIAAGSSAGTPGVNGAGQNAYAGPCPPAQYEPKEHRYFFRLYALDRVVDLPEGAAQSDIMIAMEGHTLAEATLIGRYQRVQ